MPIDPNQVRSIFLAAIAAQDAAARLEILNERAGTDPELRKRVEVLLCAHDDPESFLSEPAIATDIHRFDTVEPQKPTGVSSGTIIAGRFRLLETIGEGGMGSVWMAEQREPVRRRVALKLIKPGMDSKAVLARFDAERQALAMMDHPNIAKVFDGGMTEHGLPFFVMELVKGIPLMQYCDERKLSVRERLGLFVQICQAVQHAHQKGVIHRDLKPTNILVTEMDGRPVPKVIDFGLAKTLQGMQILTDQTLYTAFGAMVGTPLYMAPEQVAVNALDVDTRTDIYALGVILYELLTGTTPVESKQLKQAAWEEVRRIIREDDPPKPSTRLSTTEALPAIAASRHSEPTKLSKLVRGDLDWIVMKCLDKDRARRYDTATGLGLDVQRHLDGEPVVAAPPSAAYRIRKFVRRHRKPVVVSSLVIVAALAGAAAYVRGIRSEQSRTEAAFKVAEENRGQAEMQRGRAEDALLTAEQESRRARHAAAMSDARYLVQQSQIPAAIARASEAWKLGEGKWEDGYLLDEIFNASRRQWTLIGRLEGHTSAYAGCVTRLGDRDYLAVAEARELQLYDARTCEQLGTIPLEGIESLIATKPPVAPPPTSSPSAESAPALPRTETPRILFAVKGDTVTSLQLPSLKKLAEKQYSTKVYRMATNASEALIVLSDGKMRVIDALTLEDRATLDWTKLQDAESTTAPAHVGISPSTDLLPEYRSLGRPEAPNHVGISPSGRVLAHAGSWWTKPLVWDRAQSGKNESLRWAESPGVGVFDFVDDTHCVVWNHNSVNGSTSDDLLVYAIGEKLELIRRQSLPVADVLSGERTGIADRIQAWKSNGQVFAGMLSADFGCAVSHLETGESNSWRYGGLWPLEGNRAELLCQDLEHGLLVLRTGSTVQIFDRSRYAWGDNNSMGYTSAPCEAGMCRIWSSQSQVGLTFTPYAREGKTRRVTLQWLTGGLWIPWSVAATPDAGTVVVMAQEASGRGRVGDRFGPLRAVVYRPGGWGSAPSTWPVANQFEIDIPPPMNGWARRFTILDPSGSTVLFTSSYSPCVRYSVADGQKLSTFPTGGWIARRSDGKLLAGVDRAGELYVMDVATGERRSLASGYTGIKGICFSAEGTRLITYLTAQIHCHDVATGRELWSRKTRIIPLAWPPEGGDRYVGYREDRGRGGSIVLADTETCETVALLNSAGEYASEAHFSPSGRELMLNFSRWRADVLRMISPEQLLADLQRPEHAWHRPLPAAAAAMATVNRAGSTTALSEQPTVRLADSNQDISNRAALDTHMGEMAIAEGVIDRVSMTHQRNALIVNLASRAPDHIIVWVAPKLFSQGKHVWGPSQLDTLPRRRIQVRGQLARYQNNIEIVLAKVEDWRFLDESSPESKPAQ